MIQFSRMKISVFVDFDYDLMQKKELNTIQPMQSAKVFDVKDVDVRKGSFGLFTNDSTAFSSNFINYNPTACSPINKKALVNVISYQCSRFNER